MNKTHDSGATNFFLQAGIIAALYTSVISFLTFVFEVIDKLFPADTTYFDYTNSTIRIAISTLIVAFPLFIWLSRIYRRNFESGEVNLVRKWLLYFTLFIAGLAMAIDLIIVINAFLGGEGLATGFLLKVASILLVAGSIFAFYIKDIRGGWSGKPKEVKMVTITVCAVIVLSVIGGFTIIGSPETQRKLARDNERVQDLSSIQWQVLNHYQSKGTVPTSLSELNDSLSGFGVPTDPQGGQYLYTKTSNTTFSLCATFELSSKEVNEEESYIYSMHIDENWKHEAGNRCFDRTIDPDKYPLFQR